MGYMRDASGRRLDSFNVGARGLGGTLANRPPATGSFQTYYATDDCGGTLHQDIGAGKWRRVYARGELLSVQNNGTGSWTKTGALVSAYGYFFEITTDEPRPVELTFMGRAQIGNTSASETIASGTKYARLTLSENGTTLENAFVYATVAGNEGLFRVTVRRNLTPGTVYTYQAYIGSQDTTTSVRLIGGAIMKAVEL